MRPAVVSLELVLDERTERAVRAEWRMLADAGISSMSAHTSPSNRPHITLAVRPELEPFDADVIAPMLPLALALGSPLLFGAGDRRILVRSVVPSGALLELHARVHAAIRDGADADHTRPGAWTPHVTLARRLRMQDIPTALAAVHGAHEGHAVGLRRWDSASRTVTHLCGGGASAPPG